MQNKKEKINLDSSNIIVTGGSGFIGSHLVEKLVELGSNVTVIDDLRNSSKENLSSVIKEIEFIDSPVEDFLDAPIAIGFCGLEELGLIESAEIIFFLIPILALGKSVDAIIMSPQYLKILK